MQSHNTTLFLLWFDWGPSPPPPLANKSVGEHVPALQRVERQREREGGKPYSLLQLTEERGRIQIRRQQKSLCVCVFNFTLRAQYCTEESLADPRIEPKIHLASGTRVTELCYTQPR